MITLARSLAGTGIKVLLPRIPPLIDLQLSKEIFLLTVHFYKWVLKKSENNHPINLAGVSFGGVHIGGLKESEFRLLDKKEVNQLKLGITSN